MTNRQKILQSNEYDFLRTINDIYMTGQENHYCLIGSFDYDFVQKNCRCVEDRDCDTCLQKWLNSEYCGWRLKK